MSDDNLVPLLDYLLARDAPDLQTCQQCRTPSRCRAVAGCLAGPDDTPPPPLKLRPVEPPDIVA